MEKSILKMKEEMSSSLKMRLDHIKRFLIQGNASVLVGAGFSKNAEMDVSVSMKDWYSLGKDFYNKLYGKELCSSEINPIRLASMVESALGRNELDEMIISSLPDDRVYPGELHKLLLKLSWKDVFTTNYDTLLERAIIDAERHYEVVTNKETLLYKTSPRIIKLHGSFKNVRPFIITEEDYRTYPSKYPEFVNTVRQSLIEGILCLIGFSGNDPNFLEWIGWLRDVMGNNAAPVYLVTFNTELHISEIKLNERRGINIINLAELKSISNIKDAYNFFFEYLAEKDEYEEWDPTFRDYNLTNIENIDKTISKMREIRESYPGWLLLPQEYYRRFDDINSNIQHLGNKLSLLIKDTQRLLSFLFELDWRINISLSPKKIDWYIELLSKLFEYYHPLNKVEEDKYDSLLITLLVIYRKQFNIDKFNEIDTVLETITNRMSNDNLRRYYYERSLYYLMTLNYEIVKEIINKWSVLKSDYHSILCKSCVMAEIGMGKEALVLLNEALQNIRVQLLIERTSPLLMSYNMLIEDLIRTYNYSINGVSFPKIANIPYRFDYIVRSFKQNIQDYEINKPRSESLIHDFNINKFTRKWCAESGYVSAYLNAYRYIQAYETVGYPLGLTNLTLNENELEYIISHYILYDVCYALFLIVRTNNINIVKNSISRKSLTNINTTDANKIFDLYFNNINNVDNKKLPQYIRVGNVLLQLLSRLSTKLSSDRIVKFFRLYIDLFLYDKRFNTKVDFTTIYNSMSPSEIVSIIEMIYLLPINNDWNIPLPKFGYNNLRISKNSIDLLIKGLTSANEEVSDVAYSRLGKIYSNITKEEKDLFNNAIYKWRNFGEFRGNKVYSLRLLPYNNNVDKFNIDTLINKDISALLISNQIVNKNSIVLQNITCKIENLYPIVEHISPSDNEKIIRFITGVIIKNKDEFYIDDSESFFGGIRGFVNQFLNSIYIYVSLINNLNAIRFNVIEEFINVLFELGDNNLKTLAIISLLSSSLNDLQIKKLKTLIDINLSSRNDVILSDAGNALVILTETNTNIDIQSIVEKIIMHIDRTINEFTNDYIRILTRLFIEGGISKENTENVLNLFDTLYHNIQHSTIDEEYKADTYYESNKLLGVISILEYTLSEKIFNIIKRIEDDANLNHSFNDVKVGFELGKLLAKKVY